MRRSRSTLLLAAVALSGGFAVASHGRPVSGRPAARVLDGGRRSSLNLPIASRWRTNVDTVHSGEMLLSVLQRAGLSHDEAARALTSATVATVLDPRKIRAGTAVTTRVHADSGAAEVALQLAVDRVLRLTRTTGSDSSSAWQATEEVLPWVTDTVTVAGEITSTLTDALERGADAFPDRSRDDVAFALADILEYRIDLSRDLRVGDSVRVLLERQRAPNGMIRPGNILAARMTIGGRTVETMRFDDAGEKARDRAAYFDGEGKTMRAAFLRAPLAFRRISSVFGLRKHPILGVWRAHQGTDYAASAGTPVRALGDGTVIFAGWRGGYGRMVEIRHRNGYVTRYGHLQGFGSGIRAGAAVGISRTIGYVGQSGLATAPHLHFEVLVGGAHKDPSLALRNVTGVPLSSAQRGAFAARKQLLFGLLDRAAPSAGATRMVSLR